MKSIYRNPKAKQSIQQQYVQYLADFKTQPEREYVETRFGITHVLRTGNKNGKPLFIFQGGNCINPMTLSWFTDSFNDYNIYAPDTIGHPGFSDETRISGKDDSYALWMKDLFDFYNIENTAVLGASYGGGILLRLAAFMPEKIACAILVHPAGIAKGPKKNMIKEILLPLLLYKTTKSSKYLKKITNAMSTNQIPDKDREIIEMIFNNVTLEKGMPKLTTEKELMNFKSPVFVITGTHDIFFPDSKLAAPAHKLFGNLLEYKTFHTGHFPSKKELKRMNRDISCFLEKNYNTGYPL
ncbi:alpha/beta fold hydrolase [Mesobacillus zeae]|uniref:Alpha/beta hydrolase n=1 Tax=Mesobacillus zeae TaxID=1917180 RepID=A0A398B6Q1_9BACI|nr:alpha/beta hydrolase [Mesobacillus zeae]RID85625.1 alpha/beta hydrolase [Mesobacillus zeae]